MSGPAAKTQAVLAHMKQRIEDKESADAAKSSISAAGFGSLFPELFPTEERIPKPSFCEVSASSLSSGLSLCGGKE